MDTREGAVSVVDEGKSEARAESGRGRGGKPKWRRQLMARRGVRGVRRSLHVAAWASELATRTRLGSGNSSPPVGHIASSSAGVFLAGACADAGVSSWQSKLRS